MEQEDENKYLVTKTVTTMTRTLEEGGCKGITFKKKKKKKKLKFLISGYLSSVLRVIF